MSAMTRREQIEAYGAAYELLMTALASFPREMWQYRPAADRWTIHEIIVHIADSEANSYVRCRRLLAEPGSAVLGYDEARWARDLNYHAQSTDDALELFKWLRRTTYQLIQRAPDTAWSHTVVHSESGVMTMAEWLDIYARHVREHIAQMQALYDDWRRQ